MERAASPYTSTSILQELAELQQRIVELEGILADEFKVRAIIKEELLAITRFWLDRGVDGFRIDVLWHMVKHADFPDNPANPAYRPEMGEMHAVLQSNSTDQPEVHDIAAEMRRTADTGGRVRDLVRIRACPLDELGHRLRDAQAL